MHRNSIHESLRKQDSDLEVESESESESGCDIIEKKELKVQDRQSRSSIEKEDGSVERGSLKFTIEPALDKRAFEENPELLDSVEKRIKFGSRKVSFNDKISRGRKNSINDESM